ncbi:alpha,alpha-trehalose-phosphate synthase (UDP-forming) [Natronorubrum daqingense]|uniref:Trehalose-6-phosphate synthase n=1 Tax=Natronorubrum daqingense TaxID=588898 RepID=A0A1N7FL70_9EURY|nr:trehalose-6-phosphate synthase [Natronorubrum daqingense]APX98366.1 trehalose-6-phosphate synthase [Natronorubrum daqingense]SIS01081.1 trehalose 6-phosphate synthase [Natronorubrum daqingense]
MRFTDERSPSTKPTSGQHRSDGERRSTDETRATNATRDEDVPSSTDDESVCPDSLIVVSNRQPYRHEFETDANEANADTSETDTDEANADTSAVDADTTETNTESGPAHSQIEVDEPTGGLTAGLDPVLQNAEGTWIAWGDGGADFEVADDDHCVSVPPGDESYTLRRIDLSSEAVESYYYGFSNRVLWPLCHGFTDLIDARSSDFEWYRSVNERFAEAVGEHASGESVVWLQDYHFALAPRMIRESTPSSTTVAQFWHIPWPSASTFRACPNGRQLLEGLLGNDLLGFHVDRYAEQFLACVDRYVPDAEVDRSRGTVHYAEHTTRVVATPMGVDAESYDEAARSVSASDLTTVLDRYDIPNENYIALGVDRLDYSKGIPERLTAIERFLEENPSWHGEFTFVQSASLSRTDIPAYERHNERVRGEISRINERFGTDEWQPIVYTEDYLSTTELCALYRRADLLVVSSVVDGMNLVAQEYVAASVDCDGSLLLSDQTGAHETLGSQAVTIDPTDTDDVVEALERAVSMVPQERRRRMSALRDQVFETDLEWWMDAQFEWMSRIHSADDSPQPDSKDDSSRPDSKDDSSRPDSKDDSSRPDSKDDSPPSDSDGDADSESTSTSDSSTDPSEYTYTA